MKKKLVFGQITLACCITMQTIQAIPTWSDAADSILSAIDGLSDALINDSLLYDNLKMSLDQFNDEFNRYEALREEIFISIRSGIEQVESALYHGHADSQAALAAARIREQNLLQQLSTLKLETQAEITYLNRLLADVSHELSETQNAYQSLVRINEIKADELIQSLHIAADNYEKMVGTRTQFLDMLNRLIARTQENLQTTIDQTERIEQEIRDLTDTIIES